MSLVFVGLGFIDEFRILDFLRFLVGKRAFWLDRFWVVTLLPVCRWRLDLIVFGFVWCVLVLPAGGSDCYWCSVDCWYLVGLELFNFSFFPFVLCG